MNSIDKAHLKNVLALANITGGRLITRRREKEQPEHLLRCAAIEQTHKFVARLRARWLARRKRMQFAVVNNERTAPSMGLVGTCPACGGAMIAKCGNQRVHHWAHRGERCCDIWWESETPWHRDWKSNFREDWREKVRIDASSGEKHIADVYTEHRLTLEFQHSHLRPDERIAREKFYGNMFWVVDGARLKRDLPRFVRAIDSFRTPARKDVVITSFPQEAFPFGWLDSTVPVLFDFTNAIGRTEEEMLLTRLLWCLLPKRVSGQAVVLMLSREAFVTWAHAKDHSAQMQEIYQSVSHSLLIERVRQNQMAMRQSQSRWPRRAVRRYARF